MWWPTRWPRSIRAGLRHHWDATIAYRRSLWNLGLAWPRPWIRPQRAWAWTGTPRSSSSAARLKRAAIQRRAARQRAGTDHLAPEAATSLDDVIRAYEEQIAAIEALGAASSLWQPRAGARRPVADDYHKVYDRILGQVKEPVIIHWLGEMFDPALAGYWGMPTTPGDEVALDIIARNRPSDA